MSRRKPIVPPQSDPQRKLARIIFDSSIGAIPFIGPALVRIYQFAFPPKSERDREAWQSAISEQANEYGARLERHEAILMPHEDVTGVCAQLIVALARDCSDGLGRRRYDCGDLQHLLPDATSEELKDDAFECQRLKMARITTALGGAWWLQLTPMFYQQVDPQVMGWSPIEDAKIIATHMLAAETGRAASAHALCGWDRRRFNPAYQRLVQQVPPHQVSKERTGEYPAASVLLLPETKAILVRLAK